VKVRVFPSDRTGCGFYRILAPVDALIAGGADVELEINYQFAVGGSDEAPGDINVMLSGSLGRTEKVVSVADPECDVIVLQRPAHKHVVEAIPHLQAHGCAVVCEYDDDFDSVDRRNPAYMAYDPRTNPMQNKIWAKLGSSLADLVTVTTPALVKRYGAHGRVVTLPNYVPEWYLGVETKAAKADWLGTDLSVYEGGTGPRIGWAGNPASHPGDLAVMGDAIVNLMSDTDTVFRTIGTEKTAREVGLDEDAIEVAKWVPIEDYPAMVASFDIGVVPLRDSTFNRAKSWLKGLEYAALGVPFVASQTKPYKQLHSLGICDVVQPTTASTSAWTRALMRYVEDEEYRLLRAEEGRIQARTMTVEAHAEDWLNAWRNALTLRRAT